MSVVILLYIFSFSSSLFIKGLNPIINVSFEIGLFEIGLIINIDFIIKLT